MSQLPSKRSAENALFLPVTKADYRVIPWATFTDPELARVGLTEQQARERHGIIFTWSSALLR